MKKLLLIPLAIFILTACANNTTITENSTTTSIEEVQTTTESTTTNTVYSIQPKFGVYLPKEEDSAKFIYLEDKFRLVLYDMSMVNNGRPPEYYENHKSNMYYKKYRYKIENNIINLSVSEEHKSYTVDTVNIISNDIIEYEGVKYYYDRPEVVDLENYELNSTGYPLYDEVIQTVIDIRKEYGNDSIYQYRENGFSGVWHDRLSFASGGFYLVDLNGDDIPEMLLGCNNSYSWIYDIFTIKDNKLVKLATLENPLKLYTNRTLVKPYDSFFSYKMINDEIVLHKAVVKEYTDETYKKYNSYLCEKPIKIDEEITIDMGTLISNEEAEEIRNIYKFVPIEFTLFFKY